MTPLAMSQQAASSRGSAAARSRRASRTSVLRSTRRQTCPHTLYDLEGSISEQARSSTSGPGPVIVSDGPSTSRRRMLLAQTAATALCLTGALRAPAHAAAALVDDDVSTAVFKLAGPSVCSIAIVRPVGGVEVREPIGSGVVWDAIGPHVLTNFHIIPPLKGTSTILEVTLTDALTGVAVTVGARVAGTDSIHDLAVLQLLPLARNATTATPIDTNTAAPSSPSLSSSPPPSAAATSSAGAAAAAAAVEALPGVAASAQVLPAVAPIRLGSSADLRVGQTVYALGCLPSSSSSLEAAALSGTMSVGLLSGVGRSIPSPVGARIYGVLQTDAVINAGNSGGPLLDSAGRLVGLNTAVGRGQEGTGRGSGVSFALPADLLYDLVPKIIVYGNPYGKK